ncbi:hypothetical protein GOODEAATRI_003601, partial [Goodea atripinnis]
SLGSTWFRRFHLVSGSVPQAAVSAVMCLLFWSLLQLKPFTSRVKDMRLKRDDFEMLKVIGRGAFGEKCSHPQTFLTFQVYQVPLLWNLIIECLAQTEMLCSEVMVGAACRGPVGAWRWRVRQVVMTVGL